MAAVAPSADQATDLMKNMSLESQTKASEISEATKKPSTKKYGSFDTIDTKNGQIPSYERSTTPLLTDFMDPNMCYLPNVYPSGGYYYGASYDGTTNDWDEYSRYMNGEGVELSPGVYGENGSMMYHHGYGYTPYGPYSPAGSPVPTVDGQLYGAQHYQYPAPYFQHISSNGGPFTPNAPTGAQGNVATSAAADQKPLPVESANGNSNGITNGGSLKGSNGLAPAKSTYQNSSYNANGSFGKNSLPGGISASGYQDPRFGFDATRSPVPWVDGPLFTDGQARPVSSNSITSSIPNGNSLSSRNQNLRPQSHLQGLGHPRPLSGMNTAHGFVNRMYPNKLYPYGNAIRSHIGYGSNGYDSRTNGRGWYSALDAKYKPRGRGNGLFGYGNESADGMNELNRGPRAKGFKNQKVFTAITLVVKGQEVPLSGTDDEKEKLAASPDREQYNNSDFVVDYANAKFYIIKSYSEDDVHKSIKYNVWASTPNGNKKLDSAYQEAQEKAGGCPIFLFFSVNTSGQFVGLAEMVGPVDFNKNLEFWQQDKWNGCFSLKWHIVKDVPNTLLKHIILENNENKPVTNSRDCQEVKLDQGLQMLKIFKDYSSKTSLLDDFAFYEGRQKAIQEKKAKNQLQKQVWEGKPSADEKNKEATNGDLSSLKPLEVALEAISESTHVIHSNGEMNASENGSLAKTAEGPKGAKLVAVAENRIVANGVSNGC